MSERESATQLKAPQKYAKLPGDPDLVYGNICQVLSERKDQVDWDEYTGDEWRLMGVMAETEGVGPLLYWNFKDGSWPEGMPEPLQSMLKQSYYNTLANNTILYEELERILTALSEEDIPVIVLKGAALAVTVYEDIGLRPMGDLDLLIRREQLSFALSILQSIGLHKKKYQGRSPWIDHIIDHHVVISGYGQDRLAVEIHWSLIGGESDWRTPSLDWFWDNAKHFTGVKAPDGKDESIKQLAPTAHLAYLSAHLMLQHGGIKARLIWYYDLYLHIYSQDKFVDWDILLQRVDEYRWSYALYTTLVQVNERFQVSYPKCVNETLQKVNDQQSERLVQSKSDSFQSRTIIYWNTLLSMNWSARMRFLLSMLIPTPAFMIQRYKIKNPWMLPLYYLYRWGDSFIDIISTMEKVITHVKK